MKLSHIRSMLSEAFKPKPMASRKTHTAYSEQFVDVEAGAFNVRIYDYATSKLLEEFSGFGDKNKAAKEALRRLKKYRRS